MQIIPVLDVMQGKVVRGVAGRREDYRPVESIFTSSSEPWDVAQALHDRLGLSPFYVADLDGIRFRRPQKQIIRQLAEAFPGLWVDSGIHQASDADWLLASSDTRAIIGQETLAGPQVIAELLAKHPAERIVFSLDLQGGAPVGNLSAWPSEAPLDIAREVIQAGVPTLIVLDLAGVGINEGVSTRSLCEELRREFPHVRLITGGGVRHVEDLMQLKASGADGALVASALHNGHIGRAELEQFQSGG